jgi:hypothetical protein
MVSVANDVVERTSRLTGLAPQEVYQLPTWKPPSFLEK